MDKQIDNVIQHIKDLENRLGYVDNNLRYIKVIQALKYWLDKFDNQLSEEERIKGDLQPFMKVTSVPVVDFPFMIGYVIPY